LIVTGSNEFFQFPIAVVRLTSSGAVGFGDTQYVAAKADIGDSAATSSAEQTRTRNTALSQARPLRWGIKRRSGAGPNNAPLAVRPRERSK
jgi:hypothetical protein